MSRLLLKRQGTTCFLTYARGVVKLVWYGELHFKRLNFVWQRKHKKNNNNNIHKRLKNLYIVNSVNKSTDHCWTLQIASSEKGQAELT